MSVFITGEQSPAQWNRAASRGLLVLVLGGLLVLLGAQSASAHAQLLSTTPEDGAVLAEAPSEVVLRFNEAVQLLDGATRLFPGDETPIVLDAHVVDTEVFASLPDGLADGRYALSYRIVSADGHPVSGAISFTVGDATDAAPAPQIPDETTQETQLAVDALTTLQYLGLLTFAGLMFFIRIVLRSTSRISDRTRGVVLTSGIIAVAASVLLIPVSALNVAGGALWSIFTPTAWMPGVLWPPVVTAAVVLFGLGISYFMGSHRSGARMLSTFVSLAALCSPVLVGHSQLVEPRALVIAADIGHLVAGGFWIGGVVGLLLFLTESRSRARAATDADPLLALGVVQRFSSYALWAVLLLAISGTVMGIMIVGTFESLLTTAYGLTLLLKLSIVVPVIAIAAYNRKRLLPAILSRPENRLRWRTLHRTLAYEAALLVAVLAITGSLTNQSPHHVHHDVGSSATTAAQTVDLDGEAQQLTVHGTLAPTLTGVNELAFTLRYQGEAVTPESVSVRARLPEQDLGPFQSVPELDSTTGEYTASLSLPTPGEWQIQILARVSTFAEPIVTIPVTIR